MADINFQPVFEYLAEQFGDVQQRFEGLENKADTLQTSVDGLAKMTKDNHQEIIVVNNRLDKLEAKVG